MRHQFNYVLIVEDAFKQAVVNDVTYNFPPSGLRYLLYTILSERQDLWYWPEQDDDMRWLSQRFPQCMFAMQMWGDDPGDVFCAYYKNGKGYMVKGDIVFATFDESHLT